MPLYRRLPKRGFNPLKKEKIAIINLSKINELIEKNKINEKEKVNLDTLKKINILGKSYKKIKILGTGEIKFKINLVADFVSKTAKAKLEKIGGSIILNNKI